METTDTATGVTVRGLMERYEHGEIDYPTLLSMMAEHVCSEAPEEPEDWAEAWHRAEENPDDDAPAWIYVGETIGILTDEQVEEVLDALFGLNRRP